MALSTIPNNMQAAITNTELPTLTASKLPAGSVVQTVNQAFTTPYSSNSTGFVTTGFEATITPQFASSKILITGVAYHSGYGHYGFRLVRNAGTDILLGDQGQSSEVRSTWWNYLTTTYATTYGGIAASINYLDSPSTTSATTYKIYGGNPHSSSYYHTLNRTYSNGNANWSGQSASHMTLQEIKQ